MKFLKFSISLFLFSVGFAQGAPTNDTYSDIKIYTDNKDAFFGKSALALGATQTLDMAYFIIDDDATSSKFFLELGQKIEAMGPQAAQFKVRILVDYFMSEAQIPLLRYLEKSYPNNIQIKRYGAPDQHWIQHLIKMNVNPEKLVKGLMAQNAKLIGEGLARARFKDEAGRSVAMAAILAKILFDGKTSHSSIVLAARLKEELRERGVAVKELFGGLDAFLERTHHKLILADGRCFQMGGRNLSDEYHAGKNDLLIKGGEIVLSPTDKLTIEARHYPFEDLDVKACEKSNPGKALAGFNKLWESPRSVKLEYIPLGFSALPDPWTLETLKREASKAAHYGAFEESALAINIPQADGKLVENLPPMRPVDRRITQHYIDLLKSLEAGDEVDFANAYFYIDNDFKSEEGKILNQLYEAFTQASDRGVLIRIYTNSGLSTDLSMVNTLAYQKYRDLIVNHKIQIFELGKGSSLHMKGYAVHSLDSRKISIGVGSYNLDPRSELGDTNNFLELKVGAENALKLREQITDKNIRTWIPVDERVLKTIEERLAKMAEENPKELLKLRAIRDKI